MAGCGCSRCGCGSDGDGLPARSAFDLGAPGGVSLVARRPHMLGCPDSGATDYRPSLHFENVYRVAVNPEAGGSHGSSGTYTDVTTGETYYYSNALQLAGLQNDALHLGTWGHPDFDAISVPAVSDWGTYAETGSGPNCGGWVGWYDGEAFGDDCPPLEDTKPTIDSFDSMDPGDYRDYLNIENYYENWFWGPDLFLIAWGLLVENIDLVDFASCWLRGPDWGDKFRDKILSGDIKIKSDYNEDKDATAWVKDYWHLRGWVNPNSIYVNINEDCDLNAKDEPIWWGCSERGSADKLCIAIKWACLLGHELSHLLDFSGSDYNADISGRDAKCYTSYMLQNILTWAFANRYHDALIGTKITTDPYGKKVLDADTSTCCTNAALDGVFGYGGSDVFSTDCASKATKGSLLC